MVDDEDRIRKAVSVGLRAAGFEVTSASDGLQALEVISSVRPDLVLSDVRMPVLDGIGLLERVRSDAALRDTPFILLTARDETSDVVAGLGKGADDYLAKPFAMQELVARVQAKLDRPPIPVDLHPRERSTGVMSEAAFRAELEREIRRSALSGRPGVLAEIDVHEAAELRTRLGTVAVAQVWREMAAVVAESLRPLDLVGTSSAGRLVLLLPETSPDEGRVLVRRLGVRITVQELRAGDETVRVTPIIGYTGLDEVSPAELETRAGMAVSRAGTRLDLEPVGWEPGMVWPVETHRRGTRRWRAAAATVGQLAGVVSLAFVAPFLAYVAGHRLGVDLALPMYYIVVVALLATAVLIWIEGVRAMRRLHPPETAERYPPAAALIAAYLPNEAETIVETVLSFLRTDYPGELEILLAYNTPRELPVEETLRELAAAEPRFRLIPVPGSTSKAQNVNYALDRTRAEMIAIFDADHHPEPGSFARAWRWLAAGYDVVQGRNVVRNGAQTWVARTVAIEFELIYGVSHPGRERLHQFGIFGGSNGFWRATVLRRTRMQGSMLTEDIDSSVRLVADGGRIRSDPLLVSTELAPTTVAALWHQRLRWAQGWFQVSLRHTVAGIGARQLTTRQKLGVLHLLAWREVYPWLSVQIFPIIAFWVWRDGGTGRIDWLVPVFVFTTVFTVCTGPAQTIVAYRLSHPSVRRETTWYWWYTVLSVLWYSHFKVVVSLLAQSRHLCGQRQWRVTPRGATRRRAGGA